MLVVTNGYIHQYPSIIPFSSLETHMTNPSKPIKPIKSEDKHPFFHAPILDLPAFPPR